MSCVRCVLVIPSRREVQSTAPDFSAMPPFMKTSIVRSAIAETLCRAHLWTPLIKPMLVVIYHSGQGHSRNGEDKNSDEDLVGLEGGAGNRDHETDPRCRRVELANHDADKSATHRQSQTGQNEWHGRWKHDRLKDLPIRSPKASCS